MKHSDILGFLNRDQLVDYRHFGKVPTGYREVNGELVEWDWSEDESIRPVIEDIYSLWGMQQADPDGEMKHQIALFIKKALEAKEKAK